MQMAALHCEDSACNLLLLPVLVLQIATLGVARG